MSYGDMVKSFVMLFTTFLKRIFMRSSLRVHPAHVVKEYTARK
jgi:hypothetical protein